MPRWIFLVPALLNPLHSDARNWQMSVERIECGSLMTIATRVRYLGPSGAVEAPVSRLVDERGERYLPRSVVWRSGAKPLAELISAGGLRILESGALAEIQWNFEMPGGDLRLEFGDLSALLKRTSSCGYEIKAPAAPRRARVEGAKLDFPVHRGRYPCAPNAIIEAEYPPYLPRLLLLFGRGYLPNAREIDLPMGWAAAQSYFYVGPDDVIAIENAARQALLADFPEYGSKSKYFGFNWGTQKAQSGNDMHSIGIYELRPCPR
jgi:hypothetical protein